MGTIDSYLLPTASEGWGKVMFSVCSHLMGGGYPPRGEEVPPPPSQGRYPPRIGQGMEYLIRCSRYASCVHAGGLSGY